jgi:DNA-binding MarR family transcriptional regulator
MYYCTVNDFSQCPTEGAIGLLALLIREGRAAEGRLDDALATAGLTFVQWRTLDMLVKAGEPVSLKRLPEQLGCVKSNVTQLIDKLEAEGVLKRVPDPDDRRGTRVELTGRGQESHKAGRNALESATQKLFARLSQDERETLRHYLLLLNDGPTS